MIEREAFMQISHMLDELGGMMINALQNAGLPDTDHEAANALLQTQAQLHSSIRHRHTLYVQMNCYRNLARAAGAEARQRLLAMAKHNETTLPQNEMDVQQAMGVLLACAVSGQDNMYPFSGRPGFAQKLLEIGEMMADAGMQLPDDFYPRLRTALRGHDGPSRHYG